MKVIIYKIVDNTNGNTYFGSTTMTLDDRIKRHIYMTTRSEKTNIAKCSSFEIIKNGDYKIEEVEEVEPNQRYIRERYYIDNFSCVNIMRPTRTQKERSEDWYNKNKELAKERSKQWYEKNKEQAKERRNQWCEKNKDKLKEIKKKWIEENRDRINESRRERRKQLKSKNTLSIIQDEL